jgi:RimJ/RimL family protein N-acetyltransferase
VEVRPLQTGDRAAVLEIFAGLGPRSRELRFLTPKPRLSSADLRQLTAVDHQDHVALLAVTARHGRPIGVARFVRDPAQPDSADVAVAVVDAWQQRGVGTLLGCALVARAREVGLRCLTMVMSQDNDAAVRLLHRSPGDVHRIALDRETAEFALLLDGRGARP